MITVTNNPSVKISYTGDPVTNYLNTYSFTLENKVEETANIIGTAPVAPSTTWTMGTPYVINYANVQKGQMLFVYGDGTASFNINFTETQTIGGTPTSVTFSIPNDGTIPTLINLNATFLSGLTALSVSTSSQTSIQVFVGVYGNEAL